MPGLKGGRKPWKKGAFSKKLIPPYVPNEHDILFMQSILLRRDPFFLAFDKPSGLPCQTRNPDDRTFDKLLAVFARSNGKRPKLVHRLDAQTSGVIITANTKPAAAFFGETFAGRAAQKTYLALCAGPKFEEKTGVIEAPLERYQEKPNLALMRVGQSDAAQDAVTDYKVISSTERFHLLQLRPRTGRMHQIRAHLAHIGRPILGDPYYGGVQNASGHTVPRLMLHAQRLIVPHPEAGEIDLTAPLHEDMLELAVRLGLDPKLAQTDETG